MTDALAPLGHLGQTRTRTARDHALIAPDGHVETSLPGWKALLTVLISPQLGARHSHFLARFEAGGAAGAPLPGVERFVYLLAGELTLELEGGERRLGPDDFAYLPAGAPHALSALSAARASLYERRYLALPGLEAPQAHFGNAREIAGEPFLGDDRLIAKKLLPDDPRFDLAVNTMNFAPGASLPFAETHFMEHGLLMLAGQGIYRLGDAWYPVTAGDAIWMGPYCPQWFGALGREWSSYLLYKEANRDVFAFEKGS